MSGMRGTYNGGRSVRREAEKLLDRERDRRLWRLCGHCVMKKLLEEKEEVTSRSGDPGLLAFNSEP